MQPLMDWLKAFPYRWRSPVQWGPSVSEDFKMGFYNGIMFMLAIGFLTVTVIVWLFWRPF